MRMREKSKKVLMLQCGWILKDVFRKVRKKY